MNNDIYNIIYFFVKKIRINEKDTETNNDSMAKKIKKRFSL